MVEQIFKFNQGDEDGVEKVIMDENVHYIHMTFSNGKGLPEHFSNAPVYMTVLRGTLSIGLDGHPIQMYTGGTLLKIPKGIKMNVRNAHAETLELIVVKAPAPGK